MSRTNEDAVTTKVWKIVRKKEPQLCLCLLRENAKHEKGKVGERMKGADSPTIQVKLHTRPLCVVKIWTWNSCSKDPVPYMGLAMYTVCLRCQNQHQHCGRICPNSSLKSLSNRVPFQCQLDY